MKFRVTATSEHIEKYEDKLKQFNLHKIPTLGGENYVVDIRTLDEFLKFRTTIDKPLIIHRSDCVMMSIAPFEIEIYDDYRE